MTEMAGVGAAAEVLAGDQAPHRGIDKADAHGECANCGAHLTGPYCHQCGQKGHLHTRIWHMAEDFIEGVMHFDGRLWRTLPLLAFRPGRLSRAWIEGKRVRYVAPLHIFLFGIFLFFLVLSLTGGQLFLDAFKSIAEDSPPKAASQTGASGALPTSPGSTNGKIVVKPKKWTVCARPDLDPFRAAVCEAFDHIKQDPKYYAYKAESTTYKLAPLLAPISMLILAVLLLFKRGYTFYDHGVVSLYGLSFFALIVTLAMALRAASGFNPGEFVLIVLIVHVVLHLRGAYKLSWFGATLRALALGLFTAVVFTLFLFGVAAFSAA